MRVLARRKFFRHLVIALLSLTVAGCTQSGQVVVPQPVALKLSAQCDDPVIMMVVGRLNSADALKEYSVELQKLNTYPEQQGYYLAEFRPTEMLEGSWPDNQFVLTAKFPCVEAARGFWFAEEYQAIRHLRSGAGDISVSIHPINDVPKYINGAIPKRLIEQRPTQSSP